MKKMFFLSFVLVLTLSVSAKTYKILGIGNSFTVDALEQHFQPILDAQGIDAIIGYPYKGGTELNMHDSWYKKDTAAYNYKKFTHGEFTSTGAGTYTLKKAIQDEAWDYVMIQTDHNYSGVYKYYFPYLTNLISYVKKNCSNANVKIGLYMTWAYDASSTYKAFPVYNNNQKLMYDSIVACVKKALPQAQLEILIPSGTAVQNARTSYIGDNLNRDGYHLNYDYGRYITALCWYETIFSTSALNVTYKPSAITDYCADMCRHAAHYAIQQPYKVTDLSKEYGNDPEASDVIYTWDFQSDASKQKKIFNGGLSADGHKMTGVCKASTTFDAGKGVQMPSYKESEPDSNYVKICLTKQSVTEITWTFREASTGARTWKVYYMIVKKDTDIKGWNLMQKKTGTFGTRTKESGACQVFEMKKTIDLADVNKTQDIYFFHQCSNSSNNLGFCKLSTKVINAESSLQQLAVNDVDMLQDGVKEYAVEVDPGTNIKLMALPTTATSNPNVYVGVEDIERTATRGLFYVPAPKAGESKQIIIKVISQSPSHFTEYKVNVTGKGQPSNINEKANVNANQTTKMMKDNQVLILRDGSVYDVLGNRITQ